MTDDINTLRRSIDAAASAGDMTQVLRQLDTAVAASPQRADLHLLRGMTLLSVQRVTDALDDLDCVLQIDPGNDAARFHRALALFGQERLGEALADFQELCSRRPETVEPWANAGMILLRMERFEEAIPLLRRATALSPGHLPLRRSLANALCGAACMDEALGLYESVVRATPHDPAALTDYAMALLAVGQPKTAHAYLLTALKADPTDQTTLAGLYLSANELGLSDIVALLMDYPRLLSVASRPAMPALDRDALRQAVLAHPGLVWQPAGRSTYQGRQSPMLDLSPGSPFADFGRLVHHVVNERLIALRNDPALRAHPWVRMLPTRWHLQAWCTVLDSGGRQTPHIHPAGRLSGVYYLDLGNETDSAAGTLVFGHAPDEVRAIAAPRAWSVSPQTDAICCFPSYFFHHTAPFQGHAGPRISLAFDVMPMG